MNLSILTYPGVDAEVSASETSGAKTICSIISSVEQELLAFCKREGHQGRLPSLSRKGGGTVQKERTYYHKLILLLFGLNIRSFHACYTHNTVEHTKCAI